jgi:hypothetical protein
MVQNQSVVSFWHSQGNTDHPEKNGIYGYRQTLLLSSATISSIILTSFYAIRKAKNKKKAGNYFSNDFKYINVVGVVRNPTAVRPEFPKLVCFDSWLS